MWIFLLSILFICFLPFIIALMLPFRPEMAPSTKMSFEDFKKFYNINPKRFYLYDRYPEITVQMDENRTCYFDSTEDIVIIFSMLDYHRYRKFYKSVKKHEDQNSQNELDVRVLKTLQKDVEAAIEQSNKTISKGMNMFINIHSQSGG